MAAACRGASLCELLRLACGERGALGGLPPSLSPAFLSGRGGAGGYLGNLAAGRNLLLLVDPLAFGAAGVRYALATAGEGNEPGVERPQEETESESSSSGSGSSETEEGNADAEGQAGDPPLPQELQEVQARQTAEAGRLRTKRATRIVTRTNPSKRDTRGRRWWGGRRIVLFCKN